MTTRPGRSEARTEPAAPVPVVKLGGEVSMRDVAERAAVSVATVSRVLNGSESVRPDARERVAAAIAELGYRPNRLARNLRRRNAEMIGVVVSDIENPHFTTTVRAVEDAAFGKGYRLLLCNTDEQGAKQRAYLEMLADERVSGVILSPSDPSGDEIGALLDRGIPVVALDRHVDDARADAVVSDGEQATGTAVEHLLAAGHERIAFVAGPAGVETSRSRRAGYEAALRARALDPVIVDGRFRIEGGRAATAALLAEHAEVTALVVGNNLMAIGALKALAHAGRRVPRDVAVVALDDPFWAELVQPPLTVLAQPVRAMAEAAVRLLLERVTGRRDAPREEIFQFELRVRGSSRTAPADREAR